MGMEEDGKTLSVQISQSSNLKRQEGEWRTEDGERASSRPSQTKFVLGNLKLLRSENRISLTNGIVQAAVKEITYLMVPFVYLEW